MKFNIETGRHYDCPQVLECTLTKESAHWCAIMEEEYKRLEFKVLDESRKMGPLTITISARSRTALKKSILSQYDNGNYA